MDRIDEILQNHTKEQLLEIAHRRNLEVPDYLTKRPLLERIMEANNGVFPDEGSDDLATTPAARDALAPPAAAGVGAVAHTRVGDSFFEAEGDVGDKHFRVRIDAEGLRGEVGEQEVFVGKHR